MLFLTVLTFVLSAVGELTPQQYNLLEEFISVCTQQQQCANSKISDEVRAVTEDEHNKLRSILAFGHAKTKGGGFAPSGKNIYKLVSACTIKYSRGTPVQDLQWESRNEHLCFVLEKLMESAMQSWWNELKEYGISNADNIMTVEVFNQGVGHFTQVHLLIIMAWGDTTKVGCGIARNCGKAGEGWNSALVVCQYLKAGNYINEPIYELGDPCKVDADCTTFSNSVCLASEGLCDKDEGNEKSKLKTAIADSSKMPPCVIRMH
ncbi:unnamed protein product [Anisakis simplex]|uniref:SCP domain-containing protein n=1 Tax=Anisakis simplex TaxID=6269 RepID=A0A0M3K9E0_ANISI|nr:unnamed protein product [Anisakis simplex]